MTVKHKIWRSPGKQDLRQGNHRLLHRIEEVGSLKGAVAGIQMCFVTAWRMLRDMERHLGFPLLERKIGGASGGGSRLTPAAIDLRKRYEALSREVEETIQEIYAKHFG